MKMATTNHDVSKFSYRVLPYNNLQVLMIIGKLIRHDLQFLDLEKTWGANTVLYILIENIVTIVCFHNAFITCKTIFFCRYPPQYCVKGYSNLSVVCLSRQVFPRHTQTRLSVQLNGYCFKVLLQPSVIISSTNCSPCYVMSMACMISLASSADL